MKPNISFPALRIAVFFLATIVASAGKDPISVSIASPREALKAGAELVLRVTVKNTSDTSINFRRSPGLIPEEGSRYQIEVHDAQGHPAQPSKSVLALKGKTVVDEFISNISYKLHPGQSFEDQVTVTRYFDLSHPGKYTISVARPLEPLQNIGKGAVRSNTISITVIK